jgi:methionyl aminopeptidase
MTPQRQPPAGVPAPDYALTGTPATGPIAEIRTPEDIERIRRTGCQAADVLVHLAGLVRPGVTTDEIDAEAFAECARRGIYPSTLNYFGYPKSICTSVNEVICHGVPDSRPLRPGDTVNLDVTVFAEGVHGDCSATLCVGEVNPVAQALVTTALLCMQAGVRAVRPGRPFSDIGAAVDDVAPSRGHSIVTQFVGHGIGPRFHTGLQVLHHRNRDARPMLPGMVFTVEPMVNAGSSAAVLWDNGWTAVTADLARSAQFEHTVLVTERGVEVLTPNPLAPV